MSTHGSRDETDETKRGEPGPETVGDSQNATVNSRCDVRKAAGTHAEHSRVETERGVTWRKSVWRFWSPAQTSTHDGHTRTRPKPIATADAEKK